MTDPPAVSIVLPTYDRLQFLRPCVASIFGQTFRDFELIIVDDGSGEPTLQYLRSLVGLENVRVLHRAHSGNASRVRNAGISEARGEWVAFMDSDDLWTPPKLERQLAALRTAPGCRWSYTAFVMVDENDEPLSSERGRPWTAFDGDIFDVVVRGQASVRTAAVVASTELVREVGGFDERMESAEDYDLWAKLALRSPASVVDEPLLRFRRYPRPDERRAGSAHLNRDHSLRELAAQLTGSRRRLVCAERSRNAFARARELAANGEHRRALGAVATGVRLGWRYPRSWLSGANVAARLLFGTVRA